MPNRCPSSQNQESPRLLDLYDYKLSTIHQLTDMSHTSLSRLRDEQLMNIPDLSFKRSFPIPYERKHITEPPPTPYKNPTILIPCRYLLEIYTNFGDFKR